MYVQTTQQAILQHIRQSNNWCSNEPQLILLTLTFFFIAHLFCQLKDNSLAVNKNLITQNVSICGCCHDWYHTHNKSISLSISFPNIHYLIKTINPTCPNRSEVITSLQSPEPLVLPLPSELSRVPPTLAWSNTVRAAEWMNSWAAEPAKYDLTNGSW